MTEPEVGARLIDEILSVLLGVSCAGCDEPGRMLCDGCRQRLRAAPVQRRLAPGAEAVAGLSFDGVPARCIRALKADGATLLARPLAGALAAVLPSDPGVQLVPVPTSAAAFRRRGYRVPDLLIRRAGRSASRLLVATGRAADQRGLGRDERARNVRGTLRARRTGEGEAVVVVDDVITTGATLLEASRVLEAAGFRVCGAVALAATPRRDEHAGDTG